MLLRAIAILSFILAGLISVSAATFTVNSMVESHDAAAGNGICADSAGRCTLRAAVEETNALAGADTVTVPAGNYTQGPLGGTQTAPIITGPLTLNGGGSGSTIMQAAASPGAISLPVLEINTTSSVTITGVTLRYGGLSGLYVRTTTTVTLNNCVIRDNSVAPGPFAVYGGGINMWGGTLTLNSTSVIYNKVTASTAGSGGGGIYSKNINLTLNSSTVSNNQLISSGTSGGPLIGAGIALESRFTFSAVNSQVNDNTASFGSAWQLLGGGIYASTSGDSIFNLTTTSVSTNSISGGWNNWGGGIFLASQYSGTVSSIIDRTTIANNAVPDSGGYGGGMFVAANGGYIGQNMTNSTISGNRSAVGGGGIYVGNSGSGAAVGTGVFNYTNCTVSGNTAYQDGGGIYLSQLNFASSPFQMNLNFVTVANNIANADYNGYNGGGGLFTTANNFNLKNSVIANNFVASPGFGPDLRGTFYSQDYNHFGDPSYSSLYNLNSTETYGAVSLGPLQSNGGATQTQSPTNFGPLVDAIANGVNGCGTTITTDQRGYGRPQYLRCDKGAVEWVYAN